MLYHIEEAVFLLGKALQKDLFGDESPDSLLVEVARGKVREVARGDDYWTRSRRIQDWVHKKKNLSYVAKSAFHKELRRGDFPRAWAFARILDRYNKDAARRYMRFILCEETRNLDWLAAFYDGVGTRDLVRMFCSSSKDWELPNDRGNFSERWMLVADEYGWHYDSWETGVEPKYDWPSDPTERVRELVRADCMEDLYELIVMAGCWTPMAEKIVPRVRLGLVECAIDKEPGKRKVLSKLAAKYHNDELVLLWHVITGTHPQEADEYPHECAVNPKMDIPIIEDYVFDCHTWVGKSRLKKYRSELGWGKPMVGRIDLRWSGDVTGTLWRYLTQKNLGGVDASWEVTQLPDELVGTWERTVGEIK